MKAIASHFLVRPRSECGESLCGYLYRLHQANGHTIPRALHKFIFRFYTDSDVYYSLSFEDAVQQLQTVIPSIEWDDVWWQANHIQSWWRGAKSRNWLQLVCRTITVCSRCLSEQGFHAAIWELPLVHACPMHGTWLQKQCNNCQRRLNWKTLRIGWTCRCGNRLHSLPMEPAPKALVALARYICGAYGVQSPKKTMKMKVDYWEKRSLERAYQQVQHLHALRKRIVDGMFHSLPPRHRLWVETTKARLVPHVWEGRQLLDWPEGLQTTLTRLARRHWRGCTDLLIIVFPSSKVGQLLRSINTRYCNLWIDDPVYQAVRATIAAYKLQCGLSNLVVFNPSLSQSKLDELLQGFARWWTFLAYIRLEPSGGQTSSPRIGHFSFEKECEKLAIEILFEMLHAAKANRDPWAYLSFIEAWPEWDDELTGMIMVPVKLLTSVFNELLSFPYGTLKHLKSLALASRKGL